MTFIHISFKIVCQIICAIAFLALFFEAQAFVFAETPTPQVPETSTTSTTIAAETVPVRDLPDPKQVLNELTNGSDYPVELLVPSINLHVPIVNVGVNTKGEMDVPDGNTKNVGWYEGGTIPGTIGSAVLDAHVYAAFKKLRYVKVGDDIYVKKRSGKYLHFRAEESLVYKTSQVPLQKLFNKTDAERLNLITCAGTYNSKLETYDKRLIVYAQLVNE